MNVFRLSLPVFVMMLCLWITSCGKQESQSTQESSFSIETQDTSSEETVSEIRPVSLPDDWITVTPCLWEFSFSGNPGLMIQFRFPEDGAEYCCDCWATGEGMLFIDNGSSDIQKESNHQVIRQARDVLVWNNMYINRLTPENYADEPGLLEVVLNRDGQIVAYAVVRYYTGEAEGHIGPVWMQELLEEYRFTGEEAALSEKEKEQKIHTAFSKWEELYGFERLPEWVPFEDDPPEDSHSSETGPSE